MTTAAEITVNAQEADGILLERYAYTSGSVEPLPQHVHEEYQFGRSFDCLGEYHYRGADHTVPTGSLSIIHSGEVHSPSDLHFALLASRSHPASISGKLLDDAHSSKVDADCTF